VLVVLLGAALLTEVIGIHALFGAFLFGAIMPPGGTVTSFANSSSLSSVFLLPIFFAYRAAHRIGLLNDAVSWAVCVGIISGGRREAGRQHAGGALVRSTWHDAFVLGA
jgi:Kef-type K+ transport system membrane component KefB